MKIRKVGHGFSGAGGVALADILANSVAVLLILIFLSVSVKQEQAEQQIKQTVDISILMARKLADSVVVNALPSSKPAYLHDYHSCAIPHDCQPSLFPIIEVYDSFSRILNTNQVLSRQALLHSTNALDEYLATLDTHQLNNIRVDIYGIGMFYLTVATLREYNAPLRHWHFLGEKARGSQDGKEGVAESDLLAQLLEQGAEGLSDVNTETQTPLVDTSLPSGVDVVNPSQLAGLEEENLLLPPEEIAEATAEATDEQSALDNQDNQDNQENTGDLLSELLEEFSRSRSLEGSQQELARSSSQRFQLRLPNFTPPEGGQPMDLDMDPEQATLLMLTFLFMAMESAREQSYFDPNRLGALFLKLIENPESYRSYDYHSLVRDVDAILSDLSESTTDNKMGVQFSYKDTNQPVQLSLVPNSAIRDMKLLGPGLVGGQEEIVASGVHQVDVLMRLYPFIYRGDRATVSSDMVMLMHPQDFRSQGERWYPIALVSHDLQHMTLGFVYGQFSSGNLLVPVDVNQVRVQSVILQSDFGKPSPRLSWQLTSAFIASGLILLFIVFTIIKTSFRSEW